MPALFTTPTASILLLTLALGLAAPVQATDFMQEYKAYKAAIEKDDTKAALSHARNAYQLGATKYGKNSLNYANLGINLADALISARQAKGTRNAKKHKEAHALYLSGLSIYEKEYGAKAAELISPLLSAADSTKDDKKANELSLRALKIAEASNDPLMLAQTQIQAFVRLVNTKFYTSKMISHLRDAYEYYVKHSPADSIERLEATFLMANLHAGNKHEDEAEELFLEVIKQFKSLNYSHPYALGSHARLVSLYQELGEADKATEHCVVIGQMRPWSDSQQQIPLYRSEPHYPTLSGTRGVEGYAIIDFAVNEQGMVVDPKVVSSKGGKGFETASLNAVKNWRYAPKFENGKPVTTRTKVQMNFEM